jgi:hypothetical protein
MDGIPLRDHVLGGGLEVRERLRAIGRACGLRENRAVQRSDGVAGDFSEVAAAMHDQVISGARLECAFGAAAAEHERACGVAGAGIGGTRGERQQQGEPCKRR